VAEDNGGKDLTKERIGELEDAYRVIEEYNRMKESAPQSPPAEPPPTEPATPEQPAPELPPRQEPPLPSPPAGHSKPAVVLREIIKSVTPKPSPQKMTREERLQDRELLSQYKGPRLYWRIITVLTMIIPPILAFVATLDLFRVRNHELPSRYKFALHYCILLLLTGIGFNYFFFQDSLGALSSVELWQSVLSLFALFFPPLLICIVIVDMIRRRNMRMGPSYLLHYILLISGLSWLFIKVVIAPDLDTPDILDIVNILPAIYTEIFPPVLFLMIILGLIGIRNRHLASRYSHTIHYCRLLIVAGTLWWILLATGEEFNFWEPIRSPASPSKLTLLRLDNFPDTAARKEEMTGRDIARDYMHLVAKISQVYEYRFAPGQGGNSGSTVVIMADEQNLYFLTCDHVVDMDDNGSSINNIIDIAMENGQTSQAKVIGAHKKYDLAFLLARRDSSKTEMPAKDFILPIRSSETIETGEHIFAIGHPLGRNFSLSDGLVSQKIDLKEKEYNGLIQISAPVSPGNSGGPVFDSRGNLIAIAARSFSPIFRAQNLNFAVRADAIFDIKDWVLTEEGKKALEKIAETHGKGKDT